MPDIPPYATWDADRLLREGVSPVLALEARIAWAWREAGRLRLTDPQTTGECMTGALCYADALAIITAPQRLSDIDAVANQSKP